VSVLAGHRPAWLSDASAPGAGIGAATTTPLTATGSTAPTAFARFPFWLSARSFSVVHQRLTLRPRCGRPKSNLHCSNDGRGHAVARSSLALTGEALTRSLPCTRAFLLECLIVRVDLFVCGSAVALAS
jgi:hypothetical protein